MIEEKYGQVRQLINMGKERGYLLSDEVNDILPAEVHSSEEAEPKEDAVVEEAELDLTPGTLEKTNDPERIYLREMGTVPLLTREGEVAIAKRIERGQMLVLKTTSRSPIVLKETLAIGEELRKGTHSIKEIVRFDDEEKIENKTRQVLKIIDK